MKWSVYKQLCNRPDYWSRWMLEQCIDLLAQLDEEPLRLALQEALRGEPLPPPPDHRGGAETQMYSLTLDVEQRQALLRAMREAVGLGLDTPLTRGRGLHGFVEAWDEYARYHD